MIAIARLKHSFVQLCWTANKKDSKYSAQLCTVETLSKEFKRIICSGSLTHSAGRGSVQDVLRPQGFVYALARLRHQRRRHVCSAHRAWDAPDNEERITDSVSSTSGHTGKKKPNRTAGRLRPRNWPLQNCTGGVCLWWTDRKDRRKGSTGRVLVQSRRVTYATGRNVAGRWIRLLKANVPSEVEDDLQQNSGVTWSVYSSDRACRR